MCVCIPKLCVSIELEKGHLRWPLVLISFCVSVADSISILPAPLCCWHCEMSLLNFYWGSIQCCECVSLLTTVFSLSTLSLSDLPLNGSHRRRHPDDHTGQEPGSKGWGSQSFDWSSAVYPPAWALHCVSAVSFTLPFISVFYQINGFQFFSLWKPGNPIIHHYILHFQAYASTTIGLMMQEF